MTIRQGFTVENGADEVFVFANELRAFGKERFDELLGGDRVR